MRLVRRHLGAAVAAASLVLGAGLGAVAVPVASEAGASPSAVLYVSHTATPSNSGHSCATAAYTSVQAAVTAAPGGATVYLCGTTPFVGSVVIQTKPLRLTGDPGAAIAAGDGSAATGIPATTFFSSRGLVTPHSVVTVLGAQEVSIAGITVEGPFFSGCAGDQFGVLQLGSGLLRLTGDQVQQIRGLHTATWGCQSGVAVQIGREYWPQAAGTFGVEDFTGNADIVHTTVTTYQKNGITADGPGTRVAIVGSTVSGNGPTIHTAQNGIQISRGATGQVHNDTISGNECQVVIPTGVATGILVFGGAGTPLSTDVQVHNDTLVNNDVGIDVAEYNATGTAGATSSTDNQVHNNTVTKSDGDTNRADFSGYTSYQAGIADSGNGDQVHNNTITGTVVTGADAAYGPETKSGGPFLVPMTVATGTGLMVHSNTFDGAAL